MTVPDGPAIVEIGEIQVTSSTVHTPSGAFPLAGSEWMVNEQWFTEQRTPRWAIVLAIVGFCVVAFFSLLFLLIRETVHKGVVVVRVSNGPYRHEAHIPVSDPAQVQTVVHQINYVRSLAAI